MKSLIKLVASALSLSLISGMALSAAEITYAYDDLNRLIQVSRDDGPVVDYSYDEVGNILVHTVSNSPDTDGDQEANFVDKDDDGDQIPDNWEVQYGFDPLFSGDANHDSDGDGFTNLEEYNLGMSPLMVYGDINGDDLVTISDALILERHLLGISSMHNESQVIADIYPVSGNGMLDVSDLIVMQKIILSQ